MEKVRAVVVEQAVRPDLDCFRKDVKVCVVNAFIYNYLNPLFKRPFG